MIDIEKLKEGDLVLIARKNSVGIVKSKTTIRLIQRCFGYAEVKFGNGEQVSATPEELEQWYW